MDPSAFDWISEGIIASGLFQKSPLGKGLLELQAKGYSLAIGLGIDKESAYDIAVENIDGDSERYLAFSAQDLEDLIEFNSAYFLYGTEDDCESAEDVANEVIGILKKNDLNTEWDGNSETALHVALNYPFKEYLSLGQLVYYGLYCLDPFDADWVMIRFIACQTDVMISQGFEKSKIVLNALFGIEKQLFQETWSKWFINECKDDEMMQDALGNLDEFVLDVQWDDLYDAVHKYTDGSSIRKCLERSVDGKVVYEKPNLS